MGHSRIMRLIIRTERGRKFLGEWKVRTKNMCPGYGAPTAENLAKWRDEFNRSLMAGGANEHLGPAAWIQERIEIYNQRNGEVVARYNPPMFEAMPDNFRNWTGEKVYPAYKPH